MDEDAKPGTSTAAAEKYSSYNSAEIETLTRDHLSMQVDCVGWNRQYNLLAVGGYQLDKEDTTVRMGILYLIIIDPSLPNGSSIIQEEEMAGILDLKWETTAHNTLAVAMSNCVEIFQLYIDKSGESGQFSLDRLYGYFLEIKSSLMALYIEWVSPTQLIYSDSAGSITMLGMVEAEADQEPGRRRRGPRGGGAGRGPVVVKQEPNADEHEQEKPVRLVDVEHVKLHDSIIWVVHFDTVSETIYTGADDGTFVAFHKSNFHQKDRWLLKRFPVGVTSINTKDDVIAVGSYDDKLRIYTTDITDEPERKMSLTHHTEINLGGAVWRILWLPNLKEDQMENRAIDDINYKIAVAAARNGIHMLTLARRTWTWNRHVSCLDYQGALAYGIDVKENVDEKSYTVATCYFDNHALHVWKTLAF